MKYVYQITLEFTEPTLFKQAHEKELRALLSKMAPGSRIIKSTTGYTCSDKDEEALSFEVEPSKGNENE